MRKGFLPETARKGALTFYEIYNMSSDDKITILNIVSDVINQKVGKNKTINEMRADNARLMNISNEIKKRVEG